MPALGLVAQGVDDQFIPSNNLAVITRKQLTAPEAVVITKKFASYIADAKQKQNHDLESGSIIILNKFRVNFQLCQEVYLYVITNEQNNPFIGNDILHNAKEVLISLCRGTDITALKLNRSLLELNFALKRALCGQVGTEILTQKPLEMSPHLSIRHSDITTSHSSGSLLDKTEKPEFTPGEIFYDRIADISKITFSFPENLFASTSAPTPPPRKR